MPSMLLFLFQTVAVLRALAVGVAQAGHWALTVIARKRYVRTWQTQQ